MRNHKQRFFLLFAVLLTLAILVTLLYIFHGVGPNPGFVLPRRRLRVLGMVLVAISVAYSTIIFQTITTMKIFTPSIIGFDALYMFIQTVMVFFAASGGYFITGVPNFLLSVILMMVFSVVVFSLVFRQGAKNIHFLLLAGMVVGTVFSSSTTFMQMLIDPEEFAILQNRLFINFNSVNGELTLVAGAVIAMAIGISLYSFKFLDAMALGPDTATSLGANHRKLSLRFLLITAMLVSASTALVGPSTFLGLIVSNLAYQLVKSYRHKHIIPICVLISIISVVGGQFILSRVFNLGTNLSVIINFIGGIYFIYLLLYKNKQATA